MESINEIKISVRELVGFIFRSGSIDNRFMSRGTALEGIKGHQKVQSSYTENDEAEVTVKYEFKYQDVNISIGGRIDGILKNDNTVTIDEIKTTNKDLKFINEDNFLHWAQAKCYAYIYGEQNNIDDIDIQLTYYRIETSEIRAIKKTFNKDVLKKFFCDMISKYYKWVVLSQEWVKTRDISIKSTSFPHDNYRKGQRELAVSVYRTIVKKKKLFAQAVTGTGKTIAVLFASIKAMGEGKVTKIFYLTAKTSTRFAAEETIKILINSDLRLKTTTIIAKNKICFKEESNCNPEYCEYARGHYDRVNDVLYEIVGKEDVFTRDVIEKYAKKYMLCPFELTLDLTLFSDCIICDYNYVFDPRVYLKRYFDNNETKDYTLLIDESHNLVERAMKMYSAEIHQAPILKMKKVVKTNAIKLSATLNKLNKFIIEMRMLCENEDYYINKEFPSDINNLMKTIISQTEEYLLLKVSEEDKEELLQLYFDLVNFSKVMELYDERYVTYVDNTNKDTKIKLYCIDPSYLISKTLKKSEATVFFSATLMPMKYFFEMLGGEKDDNIIKLNSPFSKENRCILIADTISTKYKNREKSYWSIVEYIINVLQVKKGNYITFFPSYKYMNEVYGRLIEKYPDIKVVLQKSDMLEKDKDQFLNNFKSNPDENTLGFCVLGGIYSEGVDLKADRLIGVIVVGVGLPQICLERNIIKDYFQKKNGSGYQYAYMYPGMIKVLQAAGRVIRSEEDKGIIVLIDERYSEISYRKLFPQEWFPNVRVRNKEELSINIRKFWDYHSN